MKLVVVLLIALFLSVSCGKDEGPTPVPTPTDKTFVVSGKHVTVSVFVGAASVVPAAEVELAVKLAVKAVEE